jgi:hypothetical protein
MATTTATGSGAETPNSFAKAILSVMGWPETQSNIDALEAWEQAEGGNWHNSAAYNPLNTTQPEPGATSAGTSQASIRAYTGWPEGIAATAATLQQNQRGYAGIRSAFSSGKAAQYLPGAISASAWGTSGSLVAKILSGKGYTQYGNLTSGGAASSPSSSSSTSSTGCAFGVGPWCILSQSGVNKLYGVLLMGVGGTVITVGLILVVVGALAETKMGRAASKVGGPIGAAVGVAGSVAAAPTQRRTRRAAQTQQAATQRATQTHQDSMRRAQLRTARARARRSEEGVRTQRAQTQGRTDSADIRDYVATSGRTRRQTAVASRSAGSRLQAQNKRRVAQRQKYNDVFGETG